MSRGGAVAPGFSGGRLRRIAVIAAEVEGPHAPSPAASGAARFAALAGAHLVALAEATVPAPLAIHWQRFRQAGVAASFLGRRGSPAALSILAYQWVRWRRPEVAVFADAGGLADATLTAREAGLLPADLPVGLLVLDPTERRHAEERRAGAGPLGLMALGMEREAGRRADFLVFADAAVERWFLAAHPGAAELPRLSLPNLPAPPGAPASEGEPEILLDGLPEGGDLLGRCGRFLRALRGRGAPVRVPLPRPGRCPDPLVALLAGGAAPERLRLDLPPRGLPDPFRPRRPPPGSVVVQARANPGAAVWDGEGAHRLRLAGEEGADPVALAHAALRLLGTPVADAPDPATAAAPDTRAFLQAARSRCAGPPALLDPPPLVSVCISHFNRPALLRQALDSLAAQTYPRVEVVLVDDASPSAAAREALASWEGEFAERGWQLLRNETELWQAAGRNRAARAARGEFVLIMDDDNLAAPCEIETMVRAALGCGADAVGSLQDLFDDGEDPTRPGRPPRVGFFPTGGNAALGVVWNIYGDVNLLFRRDAFLALGGYTEEAELGCEDYEIGAALAMAGRRLAILPEPLYHYRFSAVNMARGMSNERLYLSHLRPLRPLLARVAGAAERRLLRLAHGLEHSRQQLRGESYWRGADRPEALEEHGIPPSPRGEAFRLKLGLLALRSGARGAVAEVAAGLRDPRAARALAAEAARTGRP